MIIVNLVFGIMLIFLSGMHFGSIVINYYEGIPSAFMQYAWFVGCLLFGIFDLICAIGNAA
jgi:hypothetical protein